MSRVSYLLLLIISPLLLVSLAHEENNWNPRCPPFDCGFLGNLTFPFSSEKHPKCGLLKVYHCDEKENIQMIILGKQEFFVTSISQDNSLTLRGKREFDTKPADDGRCDKYFTNLSIPSSPFYSFEILENQTMFKCTNDRVPRNFTMLCNDSKHSIGYVSGSSLKPDCEGIPFWANTTQKGLQFENLFTVWFRLQLNIRSECTKCNLRRGQCNTDKKGKFHCANPTLDTEGSGKRLLRGPIFSYGELAEATNNFSNDKELGDGGFGTVYHAKLRDGREVAVKRLHEYNYRRVRQFMNEIEILTRLRHKNLVSLYGCSSRHSQQGLLLVYEYIANGTVADHLHGDRVNPASLTWPIRMKIAIETASALAYLHASDIVHRDVKTNNILLDNNFNVKVADFGVSRLFPTNVTHISTAPQGSPGYVDPEYYQCYLLTDKSDVYSFGVVLIELLSSMRAVDITRHRSEINLANLAINRIQACAIDELIDPCLGYHSDEEVKRMTTSVAELAFLCLQQIKEMRPSMDVVLKELNRIKSEGCKREDDDEVLKSMQPTAAAPPDCDELSLLSMEHIRVPSSSIPVTVKGVGS